MPKKRSRVGQSNSFLDVGVMNQHPSPELRLGAALPANFPDQSRQSVLTVSSPPLMCEAERSGFERCSQCNKMLDQMTLRFVPMSAALLELQLTRQLRKWLKRLQAKECYGD
ncbi:uncharacterized protein LOC105649960 isoform X2 [Jatropha curcas]|uniref:uncharacterized protein LOC105649960 isoform X2 n=1 Tax=Jatropha curcas TaxID=180498 RepID=UPI0009D6A42B|nr:uncharacterized protein LOC105649960 isoform X2 [Jatropha curcas]